MSTSSGPVFVFAPGAWHQPDCFQLVRDKLEAQSHQTTAVAYPSVGAEPPNKGLFDDAAAVRAELERLSDGEGKQVILVVHSYGGLVGAEAVKGLGYKQRQQEGKKGGVVLLVYLAAFVTPKGMSILKMLGGQPLPWMNFKVSKPASHLCFLSLQASFLLLLLLPFSSSCPPTSSCTQVCVMHACTHCCLYGDMKLDYSATPRCLSPSKRGEEVCQSQKHKRKD